MKIIRQGFTFEEPADGEAILRKLEQIGRVCYKSEEKITSDSAKGFVERMLKSGHHSVIEHHNISVRAVTDRGVTHEIVRHRIGSYSQESTRYCNYAQDKFGKEITVILPVWFYDMDGCGEITMHQYDTWIECCQRIERDYMSMLDMRMSAQQARAVLPNSLKTEIVMTYNLREWRHFFKLRCSPKAHPQMVDLACMMLKEFKETIPVLFDDLYAEYCSEVEK